MPRRWPTRTADHRRDRPAHALGPRVVLAVPDVPHAAREAARRAAADARDRPLVRALPARRADRDRRRLPRGAPRGGGRAAPPRRVGPDLARAVDGPDGRVHGVGRDDGARSPVRPRAGRAVGGAMPIGYLPDIFGHVAQMPQLLRLVGIEHAVAWRGIPASVDKTAFWWDAPDGSRVRCEYLYGSYSNGRDLPEDAKGLVLRAVDYEQELGDVAPRATCCLMNGTDHQMPQPWLGRVVAEANDMQDDYHFVVTSLAEYLPQQPTDGLPTVAGELRSGARANLLMGVASNRVDVHQACAAAERALERQAEPMARCSCRAEQYPHSFFARRVAERRPQQRARLVVRVQRRRSRRPGARALPRGAPDRRRPRPRRAARARERGRRATGVDRRREPDRPRPVGHRRGLAARRGPVPLRRAPTARALPTQLLGGSPARSTRRWSPARRCGGCSTSCAAPSSRAGRSRPTTSSKAPSSTTSSCRRPGPLDTRCDLTELKAHMLALGEDDTTDAAARDRRAAAPHPVRHRPGRRVRLGVLRRASTARRRPARSSRPTPRSRTSTCASPSTPATARTRSRRPTDCALTGLGRLVDGGDGGDTYNYSPPAEDLRRRAPGRGARDDARDRPGARARAGRGRLHVARARDRRRASRARRARPRP